MFTTDHHADHTLANAAQVSSLDPWRQRRRIDRLLEVRATLSQAAAERRSHRLDDADYMYGLQLAVEDVIRDQYPETFEERFSRWTADEAASEHPVGVLTPGCGICHAMARDRGLNLTPPGAA